LPLVPEENYENYYDIVCNAPVSNRVPPEYKTEASPRGPKLVRYI